MAKDLTTGIYSEVKLSIAAEAASTSGSTTNSKGLYISDAAWKNSASRKKGAVSGLAKSEELNTPLRQATAMAVLLANILAERNNRTSNKAYSTNSSSTESGEFGTIENSDNNENALLKRLGDMTKIFDKQHFLFDNEVRTNHINPKSVTHDKLNYHAVTYLNLGDILGANYNSASANGITVKLYQGSGNHVFSGGEGGQLKISLTCNSVSQSEKVKYGGTNSSNKIFLWGNPDKSSYMSPVTHDSVYTQGGRLYSAGITSSGTITTSSSISATGTITTSNYFNVTSDARLKHKFTNVPTEDIIHFIESTPIKMFNYKDRDERFIGVIAQDVEDKNIEDFNLTCKDDNGYLNIKEDKIVYILWEYVKTLKAEINELRSRI